MLFERQAHLNSTTLTYLKRKICPKHSFLVPKLKKALETGNIPAKLIYPTPRNGSKKEQTLLVISKLG
jgi:hypothetical protein